MLESSTSSSDQRGRTYFQPHGRRTSNGKGSERPLAPRPLREARQGPAESRPEGRLVGSGQGQRDIGSWSRRCRLLAVTPAGAFPDGARAASRAPDPSPDLVADRSVSAVVRPGNGYRPADSPLRGHWAAPHPALPPGPGEVLGQMTGHPAEVSLGTSTGAQASHLVISNTTVGSKWFERV